MLVINIVDKLCNGLNPVFLVVVLFCLLVFSEQLHGCAIHLIKLHFSLVHCRVFTKVTDGSSEQV